MNIIKNMEAIFLSVAFTSLAVISVSQADQNSADYQVASVATSPASVPATMAAPLQV